MIFINRYSTSVVERSRRTEQVDRRVRPIFHKNGFKAVSNRRWLSAGDWS